MRFDSVPWPCRISCDDNVVTVQRNVNHSGNVIVAYPIAGIGEIALKTGTLPEQTEPYNLAVELARGTLDRLRNQLSLWVEGGLQVADSLSEQIDQATTLLADAILGNHSVDRQIELAEECLALAWPVMTELVAQYARQVAPALERDESADQLLGLRVGPEHADWEEWDIPRCFGYLAITGWREHASEDPLHDSPNLLQRQALAADRITVVGPVWDAGLHGLPAAINETVEFEAKRVLAQRHFHQILCSIESPPDWLHLVSGLNGVGHRYLSFPQQIQLVVDIQQLADDLFSSVPMLVSFDQPWGERLAWSVGGAQSIQIADMLLRHDVRIGGFGLEINLDYWPHGSLLRDPLQWLDLIDMWSQFGMPLFVFLRAPSAFSANDVVGSGSDRVMTIRHSIHDDQRLLYLQSMVSAILSRPMVRSVIWSDWKDVPGGVFPAAGLCSDNGQPKPVYQALCDAFEWTRPP